MHFTRVFRISGALTASELELTIQQLEAKCGPLLAISVADKSADTWTTHVAGLPQDAPSSPAKLLSFVGAQAPSPPTGGQAICVGLCYVGGKQQSVLAYR